MGVKFVLCQLLLLLLLAVPALSGPLSDPKIYDSVFRNDQVHPRLRNHLVSLFKDSPDAWQLVQDSATNEKLQQKFAPMWKWLESEGVDVKSILDRTDIAMFENPFYLLPSGEPLRVRGMVAKRPIQAGEDLFMIPRHLFISKTTVLDHPILGQYLADSNDSQEHRKMIIAWLLFESWPSHSKNSRYSPFLETLPSMEDSRQDWRQPEFLESQLPENWPLKSSLASQRQTQKDQYESFFRPFFDRIAEKHNIPKELYSFERFVWAYFQCASRVYAVNLIEQGQQVEGIALIPLADLFNHMNKYALWGFNHAVGGYDATTTRNYSPGQQVYCHYTDDSNVRLLAHYGFLIPTNILEFASLNLTVPTTSRSISSNHEQFLKFIGNSSHMIFPDAIDRKAGKNYLLSGARVLAVSSQTFPEVQLSDSVVDRSFQDYLITFEVEIATVQIVIKALNDTIRSWATTLEEDELMLSKPMLADLRLLVLYRWWDKQILVAFRDQMLEILSRLLDTSQRDTYIFNGRVIYTETMKPIGLWLLSNQYEQLKNLCAEEELNDGGQESATQQACDIALKQILLEIEIQASINVRQCILDDQPITLMQHKEFLTELQGRGIQVNVTRWIHGELTDNNLWGDPATFALMMKKNILFEILLQMGLDPNWKSWEGIPLISYACAHNNDKALRSLLKHGADVNALNPFEGKTCFEIATEKNNRDILRVLGKSSFGEKFYALLLPLEKLIEKNLLVATFVILFLGFITGLSLDNNKGKK